MPAAQPLFQPVHQEIQPQPQQAHRHDAGVHGRVVEQRAALEVDVIAQPALGGEQLGHVQHRHRRAHRLAQRGEDGRQAGGQVNEAEQRAPPGAQAAHRQDQLRAQRGGLVAHQHQDLEKEDQEDDQDLGQVANAEKEQQQRDENHLGDGVEQVDDRGEDAVQPFALPEHQPGRRRQQRSKALCWPPPATGWPGNAPAGCRGAVRAKKAWITRMGEAGWAG